MWRWVERRLDRRWKRIAFVLWLPLALVTVVFSMYALFNVYVVFFSDEDALYQCHLRLAGYVSDRNSPVDEAAARIAFGRYVSRPSTEAWRVELDQSFKRCMYERSVNGSYWLNYT